MADMSRPTMSKPRMPETDSNVTHLSGRTSITGAVVKSAQVTMSFSDMAVLRSVLDMVPAVSLTHEQFDVRADFENTMRMLHED